MIAFACNPAGGGEHWLGWGWAEQAAKFCDVTLLTWDRFSREIELQAPAAGVRAVYVGVPAWVNWLGDRSGAGRWLRQVIWHRRAAAIAARLHAEEPFALVHQTTFHTFRIPFRAASWGIPAVWGPVAGGEACPKGFGPWLGNLRTVESSRHITNRLALAQPAVRRSLRAARVIFVSNQTTLNFLRNGAGRAAGWCRPMLSATIRRHRRHARATLRRRSTSSLLAIALPPAPCRSCLRHSRICQRNSGA